MLRCVQDDKVNLSWVSASLGALLHRRKKHCLL
jgi:hypothetical protein